MGSKGLIAAREDDNNFREQAVPVDRRMVVRNLSPTLLLDIRE